MLRTKTLGEWISHTCSETFVSHFKFVETGILFETDGFYERRHLKTVAIPSCVIGNVSRRFLYFDPGFPSSVHLTNPDTGL